MAQADPVRDWILYFWETQNLPKQQREMKHRADAEARRRTRGAQTANSLRLNGYGFFTSVAV